LPVDVLKLDRSFVTGLGNGGVDEPIAEAIVNLAQSLKLDVVAEGVENQAQLDVLRRLRCSHVQGFLLGRPVDADALSAAVGTA
jgi:EAL domain-containing protein (putative c-di-GMP-specific phosphodiesterase class I)